MKGSVVQVYAVSKNSVHAVSELQQDGGQESVGWLTCLKGCFFFDMFDIFVIFLEISFV